MAVSTRGVANFEPGESFSRYRIVRLLGAGAMGSVYEAVHLDLGKRVALKAVHPAVAEDPVLAARFLREGQAAARIRHPHVMDVTDTGQFGETLFMVMEYLEGENLSTHLHRAGRLGLVELCDVMLPILSAVAAVHDEGVIHRDLKPHNIVLARGRGAKVVPKLVDFGISKISKDPPNAGLTRTSALLGTPLYMSPEQVHELKNIDARSDQYSLGVILYECTIGRTPFLEPQLYSLLSAIAAGRFEPLRRLRPELPEAFERVVLKMMARDRDSRYCDVNAAARELLEFASPESRRSWHELAPAPGTLVAAQGAGQSAALELVPTIEAHAGTQDSFAQHAPPANERPVASPRRWLIGIAAAALLSSLAFASLRGTSASTTSAVAPPNEVPVPRPSLAPSTRVLEPESALSLRLAVDANRQPADAATSATSPLVLPAASPSAPRPPRSTPPGARPASKSQSKPGAASAAASASAAPRPIATSANRAPILD
jgi:serine/threonine protein kinase